MKGYYLVGEYKKVEFIKDMFLNIDDQRISHHLEFKGMSVFQAKMMALRKIYNIEPPRKITYKYDKIIAEHYRDWSYKSGYLN